MGDAIARGRTTGSEAAQHDQAPVPIGVRIAQGDFDGLAGEGVRAVGKGRGIIGAIEGAEPGIDQAAGLPLKNGLGIGQVNCPLDGSIRRGELAIGAIVEVTPQTKALRLPPDAALIVFIVAVTGHRRGRRKRQFRSQIPFRAVADACDPDGGKDFNLGQVRHGVPYVFALDRRFQKGAEAQRRSYE